MAIQWKFGMVNFPLVGNLLLGSVPGVLIGSRLAYLVPNKTLKIGIFIVIMASGLVLVL